MKNIKLLNGIPLIAYTIESALASKVDRVIVSTESEKIAKVALAYSADVIIRPNKLSQDDTPTLPVIQNVVESLEEEFEYVVTLQPTSPLRTNKHIDSALELFTSNDDADSLVSVTKVPHNMNPYSITLLDEKGYLVDYIDQDQLVLRRQDKKLFYARNGAAIYITRMNRINEYIFGGNIIPFFMNKIDSIDIDNEEDFNLASYIIKIRS